MRIKVIHMLEKEIEYLEEETQTINSKVAEIQKYV
jgi:prefoldin subunit 5